MRLFVGYNLSPKIIDDIGRAINSLKNKFGDVKWISDKNLHLTLKFLGETEKDLDMLIAAIEKIKVRELPFEIEVSSLGYFDRGDLIIWLGLAANPRLAQLYKRVEDEYKRLGFKKNKRGFVPHISVGRAKKFNTGRMEELKYDIDHFRFNNCPVIILEGISLIQSRLTSKGPIYDELYKISFGDRL